MMRLAWCRCKSGCTCRCATVNRGRDPLVTRDAPETGTGPTPTIQIPGSRLPQLKWRKARRSNASGNCVELARLPHGDGFVIRNSRHPEGPALVFTPAEITAFVAGVRDGDFDDLVTGALLGEPGASGDRGDVREERDAGETRETADPKPRTK